MSKSSINTNKKDFTNFIVWLRETTVTLSLNHHHNNYDNLNHKQPQCDEQHGKSVFLILYINMFLKILTVRRKTYETWSRQLAYNE